VSYGPFPFIHYEYPSQFRRFPGFQLPGPFCRIPERQQLGENLKSRKSGAIQDAIPMRRIRFPVFQFPRMSEWKPGSSPTPGSVRHLGRADMDLGASAVTCRTECPALWRLGRRDTSRPRLSPPAGPPGPRDADSGLGSVPVRSPERDNSMKPFRKSCRIPSKSGLNARERFGIGSVERGKPRGRRKKT
jgi:hypothetical protein